jgi:hypothetical protein
MVICQYEILQACIVVRASTQYDKTMPNRMGKRYNTIWFQNRKKKDKILSDQNSTVLWAYDSKPDLKNTTPTIYRTPPTASSKIPETSVCEREKKKYWETTQEKEETL